MRGLMMPDYRDFRARLLDEHWDARYEPSGPEIKAEIDATLKAMCRGREKRLKRERPTKDDAIELLRKFATFSSSGTRGIVRMISLQTQARALLENLDAAKAKRQRRKAS